ncbi:MAG: ribosome-binding factor A [Omnitrophica WOR_2 bacterium RIFCSPHIGHO2_01_FULL_48_9]|nr:MAG: ribosome-binding factor A [Omnitrophica WOR_2 bacterium RIFCSPHIGHO2_02_FULL_48_11]OGX30816.1 MAG: ribosome-binding factor A [Omnitrophica WOR_2 bacterium RIFCSPHIGHO2_01_FULL_48_9]
MGRIDRVNEFIRREISNIILIELQDPRIKFVTITEVNVSRDLRHARVSFTVLGDEAKVEAAMNGLNSARGLIRKMVGQRISMRYTPEIIFEQDRSGEYNIKIEEALEEIRHESEENS